MTRETKARKGQGYTLNAKAVNLSQYEGEMVVSLFPCHIYLIKDLFLCEKHQALCSEPHLRWQTFWETPDWEGHKEYFL